MDLQSLDLAFFQRFLINLLAIAALVHAGAARRLHFGGSLLPCYMFGIGLFLAAYTLNRIEITLGFAFGLFAIFSMLRYRTEMISMAEMTYLFLVIVLALICSVSPLSPLELVLVSALLVLSAWFVESPLARRNLETRTVRYERIENIRPDRREQLLADLRLRTGLDVRRVVVDSIDFMQDSAMLTIVYSTAAESVRAKAGREVGEVDR